MGTIAKVQAGGVIHLTASTAYATCDTDPDDYNKIATIQDNQNFSLFKGVTVHIKMVNSNTSADPYLNVNSTGSYPIYRYSTVAPGNMVESSWNLGSVITFTFDGEAWIMNGFLNTDTNTWKPNSPDQDGYVTASRSFPNRVWMTDADGGPAWRDDQATKTSNGLVPKLPDEDSTLKFLRQDSTWAEVQLVSKNYNGLAPQLPDDTDNNKFLRQDATWAEIESITNAEIDDICNN